MEKPKYKLEQKFKAPKKKKYNKNTFENIWLEEMGQAISRQATTIRTTHGLIEMIPTTPIPHPEPPTSTLFLDTIWEAVNGGRE